MNRSLPVRLIAGAVELCQRIPYGLLALLAWRQWHKSRRLRDLTLMDPLTGVANRPGIEREAARALDESVRDGTPLSLLMLDLDHFKTINDARGHSVGASWVARCSAVASARRRATMSRSSSALVSASSS